MSTGIELAAWQTWIGGRRRRQAAVISSDAVSNPRDGVAARLELARAAREFLLSFFCHVNDLDGESLVRANRRLNKCDSMWSRSSYRGQRQPHFLASACAGIWPRRWLEGTMTRRGRRYTQPTFARRRPSGMRAWRSRGAPVEGRREGDRGRGPTGPRAQQERSGQAVALLCLVRC